MVDKSEDSAIVLYAKYVSFVRECLITIGLVVGGGFALYKYVYLESSSARIEYNQKIDLLARKLKFNSEIKYNIIKTKQTYLIYGDWIVDNTGNWDAVVTIKDKSNPPISIYALTDEGKPLIDDFNSVTYNFIYDQDAKLLTDASFDAGRKTSLAFAISVKEPGTYLLSVQFPVSKIDLSEVEKADGEEDWFWSDQKIIVVKGE